MLNAVNEKGETLMSMAIKCGAKSILLLLLEKGADCNVKNAGGQMPIQVAMSMLNNGKNSVDIVNLLIEHYTDLSACNNTLLHMAVKSGHFEIVQKLVQKRASLYPVNIGITEIIENNPSIARFLIENGKYDRLRVLRSAVKNGHQPTVKLLLERGQDPNLIVNSENETITLLHQAVKNGHLKIVQNLIEHGANVEAKTNYSKETPLHYVVKYSSEEMIKELLKNKVEINVLDKDHCTPLWLAASNGKKEIVKVLIDTGADVDIQDNLKRKPLAIAIKNGHNDIAKMITDKLQEQNENLEPLSRRIKISDDCVVCFGPRHNVFAFQPCGHTEICEICCIRIFQEPNGNPTCPICRTRATNYMKIFV